MEQGYVTNLKYVTSPVEKRSPFQVDMYKLGHGFNITIICVTVKSTKMSSRLIFVRISI